MVYNYPKLKSEISRLDISDFDPTKPLTVLWFGGGQDSTALLLMAKYHDEFREKYCQGSFLVVMSDTKNFFT